MRILPSPWSERHAEGAEIEILQGSAARARARSSQAVGASVPNRTLHFPAGGNARGGAGRQATPRNFFSPAVSCRSTRNQSRTDLKRLCCYVGPLVAAPPPPGQQSSPPQYQPAERLQVRRRGATSSLPGLHDLARVTVSIVHYCEAVIRKTIHPHPSPSVLVAGPGVELETNKPLPRRPKLACPKIIGGKRAGTSREWPRRYDVPRLEARYRRTAPDSGSRSRNFKKSAPAKIERICPVNASNLRMG
jgi:hypothetical protein